MSTLLIIDDEESICTAFRRYFERRGFEVVVAHSAAEGVRCTERAEPSAAFVDVRLPDADGLELLERLNEQSPDTALIVITAYGSMATVAEAVRRNAYDYLPKPIDLDRAEALVQQIIEARDTSEHPDTAEVRRYARHDPGPLGIVGCSAAMQDAFKTVARAANSESSVLIRGATGTGKELIARAVHQLSPRAANPFVPVNGGALPESLVEAELFGYEKGSFTGASRAKPGRFERADRGTLFLDEIGELPLPVQVKLLRFLDQRVIERLGSVESRSLDVRVVAATNRDLSQAVEAGGFRADLFYRLAVVEIELPSLAERREDILPLTGYLLGQLAEEGAAPDLSPEAAEMLKSHDWPGNVRELRNAVEHAAVAAGGRTIRPEHLPASVRQARLEARQSAGDADALQRYVDSLPSTPGLIHPQAVNELENRLIARALHECGHNQSAAAKLLGIHRNTLRQKLETQTLPE